MLLDGSGMWRCEEKGAAKGVGVAASNCIVAMELPATRLK